jgi:hypothetical protein
VIQDEHFEHFGSASGWFADHTIYLFRDGATVLYVGQSQKDILKRVGGYLNLNGFSPSNPIRLLIRAKLPQSYDWLVEFFTTDGCVEIYHQNDIAINKAHGLPAPVARPKGISVNVAEQALIRFYHPCLNIAHNSHPTRLPASYRLPISEVPNGIVCTMDAPRVEYEVHYQAYDFVRQQNRKYTVTMHARHYKDCCKFVTQMLGYQPHPLYASEVEPPVEEEEFLPEEQP